MCFYRYETFSEKLKDLCGKSHNYVEYLFTHYRDDFVYMTVLVGIGLTCCCGNGKS